MIPGIEVYGADHDRSILLLHGAGSSRLMWIPQLRLLSDEFRTISIDVPGHGVRRDERFTIDAAAESAREAIDEYAGGQAVVVGLSVGGYVALGLTDLAPDRVLGLVLSGASASYRGWGGFETRMYGYFVGAIAGRIQPKAEASFRKALPDDLADEILAEPHSMRGAADTLKRLPGRDYYAMAARYPGPILLLNGERDKVNRKEEEAMAAAGGARIEMVEDAGHACSLTQPEAFSESVRAFVREVFAGA